MVNETVGRRYATAIFGLAREAGSIEPVGRDLTTLRDAIEADDKVKRFFYAPIIERKEKSDVLTAAFEGRVSALALHTLLLLVRKRREALLKVIVAEYHKLEVTSRGSEPLLITSAKELSAEELQAMVKRLSAIFARTFDVSQTVDPQLIGGVRIRMGDRLVDGSVAGKLEELSRTLFTKS